MRDNVNVRLVGNAVELVPYERKFVSRYHQWMQDAFLLEMTASEPLSMEEEYEMQQSWRQDPQKCTFILLYRHEETNSDSEDTEINRMVGDVNLFLHDRYYEYIGDEQIDREGKNAEVDVMVAETSLRGRGVGAETVKLMLWYGVRHLNISRFFAKINEINDSSLRLFKKLGFKEIHYVAAFQEFEFQLLVEDEAMQEILQEVDLLQPFHSYNSNTETLST